MFWLAVRLYREVVVTGLAVGSAVYLGTLLFTGTSWVLGVLVFVVILFFCGVVGLPLAVVGTLTALALRGKGRSWSRAKWRACGIVVGVACVGAAFVSSLPGGPLPSDAGRVFWFTFLVAGVVAGMRCGGALQEFARGPVGRSRTKAAEESALV